MDIIGALAEGKRGAVARSTEVAHYVLQEPNNLITLIDALSLSDTVVVSHAAHAVLTVFKTEPELFRGHKERLLALFHSADQWELIEQLSKILPHVGCSIEERDKLSVRLRFILENGKSSIARTCALQAVVDMAGEDKRFEKAAEKALQYALDKGTKAMQARARNLLAS